MNSNISNHGDLGLYSRRPRERFSQACIIRALQKAAKQRNGAALGLTKRAAKRLRCAESTVRAYISRYPALQKAKKQIEAEWRATVDEIIAEIKQRQKGRHLVVDHKALGVMTSDFMQKLKSMELRK